jgi:hypothetical protein
VDEPYGPVSIAALRDAVLKGREPPPAQIVARLPGYPRTCQTTAASTGRVRS